MSTAREVMNRARTGTAPYNEIEAMHGDAQRDDGEATDPEAARQRQINAAREANFVPEGFYWGKDASGKPLIKPSQAHINDLATQLRAAFDDDERHEQLKVNKTLAQSLSNTLVRLKRKTKFKAIMDLCQQIDNEELVDFDKQLERAAAVLEKIEQGWLSTGLVRAIAQFAVQEAASNLRWCMIHNEAIVRHENNGNEQAAENSLINFESSRTQLFIAMQIMDWCAESGAQLDFNKGARDALGLAGWSLTQRQQQERATVRQSTLDTLYGRTARATPTPEEAAESEELNDDLEGVI